MKKQPLIYLCHRIPYPPNKGDKITTYNILKFLSEYYDVYLGCFIDDKDDHQYKEKVAAYCKESFFVDLNPSVAKIKGLSAFVKGEPITLPYYRNSAMTCWVNNTIEQHKIEKTFIYSGCMAQYVFNKNTDNIHKVIQFADIDSDKWHQYAKTSNFIKNKIYMREYKTLAKYEKQVAEKFSISCFISDAEVELFKKSINNKIKSKIKTLSNGIDSNYFSPNANTICHENFRLEYENYIVFTGAMDYRPNIETVVWFTQKIWSQIITQCPDAKFYIVGSSPSKQVYELMKYSGVIVTGRVQDIRPYLKYAKAAVAPMLIARGIQNKILEAMAMERPILTSKLGIEGLEKSPNDDLFVTDSELAMHDWIIKKLDTPTSYAHDSRQWLVENYSWNAKLKPLLNYLGDSSD